MFAYTQVHICAHVYRVSGQPQTSFLRICPYCFCRQSLMDLKHANYPPRIWDLSFSTSPLGSADQIHAFKAVLTN